MNRIVGPRPTRINHGGRAFIHVSSTYQLRLVNANRSYRQFDISPLLQSALVMNTALPFQDRTKESGLTSELVRQVVVLFYDKVRCDAVLGPVFETAIGNHWDTHIEGVIQFWLTATRLGRGYNGRNFMPAHLKHRSIQAGQIPRWLALFRETATDQCSPRGAAVLIDIAERMVETLELGLSKRPPQDSNPALGNRR